MDPVLSAILASVVCSLIAGYVGFRLGRGGQAVDRRREFRCQILVMAAEAGEANSTQLYTEFLRCFPTVRRRIIEISDAVPFWRRAKFKRVCDRYLCQTQEQLFFAYPTTKDQATLEQEWEKPRQAMKRLLEDIANAA